MAVPNLVKKNSYGNKKEILIAPELAFTIGCIAEGGHGVLKAGTPVCTVAGTSILTDRQRTVMEATTDLASYAQGVLLHDVDTTAGDANATIVLKGQVDLLKLEDDVRNKITSEIKTKLKKITFMNGNK